jgi:hypothetical protein
MKLDSNSTKFLTEISSIMLNYKKAIIDFYGEDYSSNLKKCLYSYLKYFILMKNNDEKNIFSC